MAIPTLSPADIASVQQGIQAAENAKQMCQKGAACGFDFSGHEAIAIATQQRLKQVLNEFGPKGISPS